MHVPKTGGKTAKSLRLRLYILASIFKNSRRVRWCGHPSMTQSVIITLNFANLSYRN